MNQDDFKECAKVFATTLVEAQTSALTARDPVAKFKTAAANVLLSACGALVAFMMLQWATEYRDQSREGLELAKKSAKDSETALAVAATALQNADAGKVSSDVNTARITTLTDAVARITAAQANAPVQPVSPLEAAAVRQELDTLLKDQDKAIYRQQQGESKD